MVVVYNYGDDDGAGGDGVYGVDGHSSCCWNTV